MLWTVVLEETLETERRSNESILKEINLEYPLERLMIKLKLQYFGLPIWRANSLGKILVLRMIESRNRRDNRGWADWMTSPTQLTWVWANSRRWWRTGKCGMLQSMGVTKNKTRLSGWTTTTWAPEPLMQISLMDELRESQNLLDSYWIWWEFMVKGTKIEKKK